METKASAPGPAAKAAYLVTARAARRLLPHCPGRVGMSMRGRVSSAARWTAWARRAPRGDPLVWFHAASVGEALVAAPVAARLRADRTAARMILTYSSPSVERWPLPPIFDQADFLPADEPEPLGGAFAALAPSLLVLARGDVWPMLMATAVERGVPRALVGAAVRPASLRLRWPIRALCHDVYAAFDFVGATSPADARRLTRLGARPEVLEVTGDPRHDTALERVPDFAALRPLLDWKGNDPVILAGNTEPGDVALLLDALGLVRAASLDPRILLCPHQPYGGQVQAVMTAATTRNMEAVVWRHQRHLPRSVKCVIVDRRGLLMDLYALATMAYVGGGFYRQGVHAVIEPAAYGVPLAFGPRGATTSDARALQITGGALVLPRRDAAPALARQWRHWLTDDEARAHAGLAARRTLASGAAAHSARRLNRLLGSPAPHPAGA